MSITVGGHTFRTLSDPMYVVVDGKKKKVLEVYEDDVLVYPNSEYLYLYISGAAAPAATFVLSFMNSDDVEATSFVSVNYKITLRISRARNRFTRPTWSRSKDGITIHDAGEIKVVEYNVAISATSLRYFGELQGWDTVIPSFFGTRITYYPLDAITMLSGVYDEAFDGVPQGSMSTSSGSGISGITLFDKRLEDVRHSPITRHFTDARERTIDPGKTGAHVSAVVQYDNSSQTLTGVRVDICELFDVCDTMFSPYGPPATDYRSYVESQYVDIPITDVEEVVSAADERRLDAR